LVDDLVLADGCERSSFVAWSNWTHP
ncbi:MAG: hypothetical protein QG573_2245, partial [Acidobacteriota bacterium]|nr:hypothetical protein [Acidobacteriota bacterium]